MSPFTKHRVLRLCKRATTGLLLLVSYRCFAESGILTIEAGQIRGNQELPSVMTIVPWQAPKLQPLESSAQSLAVQVSVQSLERETLQRLLSYHQALLPQAEKTVTEQK